VLEVRSLLEALQAERVDYVIVGGVALVLHGSAHLTTDLDICYARTRENIDRLARALETLKPALRGAPAGLPFRCDPPTLRAGLNFTLTTAAGDLDLLGEVSGVGGYEEASRTAVTLEVYGMPVKVMTLDDLERSKRASGRPKDRVHLLEIAELRKLIDGQE
jgi:hypothetical protein